MDRQKNKNRGGIHVKNTGKWKTAGIRTAAALLAAVTAIVPVRAEEIGSSWDEDTRVHVLRRKVATAINVYTDGLSQDVTHEEGVYDGVIYDILRVNPTEHTFLQVDFSEVPGYVNELKDWDTIAAGYRYAGGINAGYFINEGEQYGRPVGAVRRHNQWVNWYHDKCVPAYGNGFATAYISGSELELKYHGWQYGKWAGDTAWQWWTGYTMDADFAVSGSFTYFADGQEKDITNGDCGDINYHTFGRAVSILAQRPDKQYLLITLYGTVQENRIADFLRALGVSDAIRMDGGGSTQMVYETDLVQTVAPQMISTASALLDQETAAPIGYATVIVDSLRMRSAPSVNGFVRGTAINGERYQVYEISEDGTYTWYRIGVGRWIAGRSDWVKYEPAGTAPAAAEPTACRPMGFCAWDGKNYWFENSIRQGTYNDPLGVIGDGTVRGREIYDPESNGWYWLDADNNGAKAAGKEVWIPYIYQNEESLKSDAGKLEEAVWDSNTYTEAADGTTADMGEQVRRAILEKKGKWVRYDETGKMLKGWVTIKDKLAEVYPHQSGNVYYYDYKTGLMAKGWTTIGGKRYFFNEITGVLEQSEG